MLHEVKNSVCSGKSVLRQLLGKSEKRQLCCKNWVITFLIKTFASLSICSYYLLSDRLSIYWVEAEDKK